MTSLTRYEAQRGGSFRRGADRNVAVPAGSLLARRSVCRALERALYTIQEAGSVWCLRKTDLGRFIRTPPLVSNPPGSLGSHLLSISFSFSFHLPFNLFNFRHHALGAFLLTPRLRRYHSRDIPSLPTRTHYLMTSLGSLISPNHH